MYTLELLTGALRQVLLKINRPKHAAGLYGIKYLRCESAEQVERGSFIAQTQVLQVPASWYREFTITGEVIFSDVDEDRQPERHYWQVYILLDSMVSEKASGTTRKKTVNFPAEPYKGRVDATGVHMGRCTMDEFDPQLILGRTMVEVGARIERRRKKDEQRRRDYAFGGMPHSKSPGFPR